MNNEKLIEEKLRIEDTLKNGAGWFYWIAGLSLINSLLMLFSSDWSFVAGLSITQIIDYIAYDLSLELGGAVTIIGLIINLIIIGLYVLLGVFANKGRNWSFIVGFILYGLDTLLLVFIMDYVSIIFHVMALYSIFKGYKANKQLKELTGNLEELSSTHLQEA
ncbi:hypothetical protein [Serpentinicella alkaliphila]|uniref:Uncharacterized protein n=1 Tax=Serpentinicella alkaliphila TaxID=1734049 RepID=A0A4R2TES5_9FIRM|nr:hypothetical protein [Serpentinicella alkaliphila]QUH26979.1 hypothetical protein HZR23_15470 [Serpentinicella alkaliphila]TCQ00577.1 hypothetical protein EDD79_102925 [Serpentinicella alkaliphila]